MELSQPRPCGAQGAKPTHDFLSLYSPAQQDPTPGIAGGYLRTHDFLQPLEQVEKNVAKEGIEKCFLPCPPSMVEHVLPGGMGTYSISYMNQSQKVPKPEGIVTSAAQSSSSNNNDENSNCSSYTGSGFTLWEEYSNVNKGKTGKENIAGARHVMRDGEMKIGVPWMTSMERPSQSSSIHNHPSTTFTSLSSSHPSSAFKNQYFHDMVKSARSVQEEEYNDEEFVIKKEPSFHHKGGISVKVDTTNPDQKPNSPRSKHSATEQRRRSKINDRFSMLRGIIPHGDQKRDKASFLLEVIEYIQFLQEKVHKYEDSYHPPNMTPSPLNDDRPTKGSIDQPQLPNSSTSGAAFVFSANSNANNSNVPRLDCNTSSLEEQLTNKPSPLCGPDTASQSQAQPPHSRSSTNDCTAAGDKLKDDDRIIESGTISISTIYSQGLSSALTQALRRSGVDLSQANISVQIDLGKRSSNTSSISPPNPKEIGTPSIDQSVARWQEESSEAAYKRLKTKA